MDRFVGRYDRELSNDGLLTMPARFRGADFSSVYLMRGWEGTLGVWPDTRFEAWRAELEATDRALDWLDEEAFNLRRAVRRMAVAEEVSLDSRGRITVPKLFRQHANLKRKVFFTGANRIMEVWDPDRYLYYVGLVEQGLLAVDDWRRDQSESEPPIPSDRHSTINLVTAPGLLDPNGIPLEPGSATGQGLISASSRVRRVLKAELRQRREALDHLDPDDLEMLLAELFHAQGYAVHRTPHSGDDGVDVWAAHRSDVGSMLFGIQCKLYRSDRLVGPAAIRELAGSIDLASATAGIMVTTSSFTSGAVRTAGSSRMKHRISLRDGEDLLGWIDKYQQGSLR